MAPARSYGLPWHLIYPLAVSDIRMGIASQSDTRLSGDDPGRDSRLLQCQLDPLRLGEFPDHANQVWKQELLRL